MNMATVPQKQILRTAFPRFEPPAFAATNADSAKNKI